MGGAGVFLSLPSIISGVVEHSSPALLGLFCLNTVLAVSILGGTLAVLPAYEADIFGPGHVVSLVFTITNRSLVLSPELQGTYLFEVYFVHMAKLVCRQGAIHSRFLLAVTAAAVGGPALLFYLRRAAELSAIRDLTAVVR